MGKIIYLFTLLYMALQAQEISMNERQQVQKECLQCHIEQQIPSELIYRRYLMTYSTTEDMQKAIFTYMKNPNSEHSIMPPQFFLKFPTKEATTLNDNRLRQYIQMYLSIFDLKKKLVLEE